MKQTTFASLAFERKKKQTRWERFLAAMEKVAPWAALPAVIEPRYPTTGRRGRPPMPLATMLRIYFMQQWYALSDPAMKDALYEVESMRRFAGLDLTDDAMPDETGATAALPLCPKMLVRIWPLRSSVIALGFQLLSRQQLS